MKVRAQLRLRISAYGSWWAEGIEAEMSDGSRGRCWCGFWVVFARQGQRGGAVDMANEIIGDASHDLFEQPLGSRRVDVSDRRGGIAVVENVGGVTDVLRQ